MNGRDTVVNIRARSESNARRAAENVERPRSGWQAQYTPGVQQQGINAPHGDTQYIASSMLLSK